MKKCIHNWLFFCGISLLLHSVSSLHAQNIQNYAVTAGSNESLVEGGGWTTLIGPNSISASAVTPIGFEVWFMGERFTDFSVTTNGVLRFGTVPIIPEANTSGIPGNARICAFAGVGSIPDADRLWRTENDGSVRYKLIGTAPNRTLVVDWFNMRMAGDGAANTGTSRFQIHVFETAPANTNGGVAKIVYGTMNVVRHNSALSGGVPTELRTRTGIGYGNGGATRYLLINTNNHPSVAPANLHYGVDFFNTNNTATPFNLNLNSGNNTSRKFYNFNPPAPNGNVSNLAISCVSSNSVMLTWSENATNEVGIVIYRSTDNVNFTFLTQLAANTTSFLNTGLTANTTYYYRVFTVTEGKLSALTVNNVGSIVTPNTLSVYSILSGNWTNLLTWITGAVPLSSQNVVIGCGVPHTVTVDGNGNCNDLTVENGSVLNFNVNRTLHVQGNLYNYGTINLNAGATLQIDGQAGNYGTINVNGGTLIINGNLINAPLATVNNGTGTIRLRGNLTNNGTYNTQTGSFHFDGNNAQLINHTGTSSVVTTVLTTNAYSNPSALFTTTPVNIPDNNPAGVSQTFTFPATTHTITNVTLNLQINHTWVGDLIVTLTSPSGTTRTLIDRPGVPNTYYGCSGDNIVVLLSDAASQSVENQCNGTPPAINGTFSPNQTLAAFIGENPSGTWTLTVSDNAGGDTGSIISSTLNVTTTSGTTSVPTSASTPGLAIPDNNNAGVNHIINVPAGGIIQNVTVDLAIDHTRIGDFRVTLTSPSGTTIKLMEKRPDNGPGSCAGDNIDLTLDDAASTAVQAQCGPGVPSISGTHSPFEALAAFIGENSTGNWTLNVSDRRNGETGRLMSATLHITAQQNIPTPPSPNLYFYNFIMENTSAGGVKTQNTDVYIAHHATWTNGVFYSDNNHLLQFINGATSTLPNNGSYADLNVRKIGNQAFNFPTGNGGYAGVIGISAPALTTDHFTARYFRVSPQTVPYDRSLKEATIHHISNCEYWILDRTNGTAAVSVSLSYDNVRSCGVGNPSALKVCRWDGTQWIDHFNGGNFATPYTGLTSAGAVSNFSPFTLGSLVTEDINPLPVSWLGFEAKAQNAFDAVLSWQTAQETDNSHFIVERSRDGLHFQAIGRVEGTNANHISNYGFIDEKAAFYAENNHLYYRLRQVDFSGKESYSPVRQVVFEAGEEMEILSLAPNPFQNQFEVRYQIPTQAAVHFALYDMAGRILWQQTNTPAAGTHRQAIEAKQLAKGTYLLKVQYQNQSEVRKVVKE